MNFTVAALSAIDKFQPQVAPVTKIMPSNAKLPEVIVVPVPTTNIDVPHNPITIRAKHNVNAVIINPIIPPMTKIVNVAATITNIVAGTTVIEKIHVQATTAFKINKQVSRMPEIVKQRHRDKLNITNPVITAKFTKQQHIAVVANIEQRVAVKKAKAVIAARKAMTAHIKSIIMKIIITVMHDPIAVAVKAHVTETAKNTHEIQAKTVQITDMQIVIAVTASITVIIRFTTARTVPQRIPAIHKATEVIAQIAQIKHDRATKISMCITA